jgi:polysaccharide pyruvyl transferase WcaK-like protein
MIFKLIGTGVHNQGAELMAAAVSERIYRHGKNRLILVEHFFGSPQDRHRYGLWQSQPKPGKIGRGWLVSRLMHPPIRSQYEIYGDDDVDVYLDASGFQYSDQWGPIAARELETRMARAARLGQKYIFLPQAFGPFNDPEVAEPLRRAFPLAELIYARDPQSAKHVTQLIGESNKVRLAPDFTSLVSPIEPPHNRIKQPFGVLVPNCRMLDKTDAAISQSHVSSLAMAANVMGKSGFSVILLAHSPADRSLAQQITQSADVPIDVLDERDPKIMKGYISISRFVIGSRFHALQSALSQGVPCLVSGWSHKYLEMCRDYQCESFFVEGPLDKPRVTSFIDTVCQSPDLIANLKGSSNKLKQKSIQMWEEIECAIQ